MTPRPAGSRICRWDEKRPGQLPTAITARSFVVHADRLWDGAADSALPNQSVVVESGLIAWVGPRGALPSDHAGLPDVHHPGATVLPGLIETHAHLGSLAGRAAPQTPDPAQHDQAWVALASAAMARQLASVGVTTVQSLGSKHFADVALREAIRAGHLHGPRIVAAGPQLTTTGGHAWATGGEVDSADDIRRQLRRHHKAGVDVIKVMATGGFMTAGTAPWNAQFTTVQLRALVREAHRLNALLDSAGWTARDADGVRVKDGTKLTVRAVSGAPYVRESRDQLNIAISAALKQNVGIDYQFQIEDSGTETERAAANDYEVFDNSYGGADVASALDILYSSDPTRGFIARGRYDDAQLDKLLDEGRFTTDATARAATYRQLQKLVTEKFYVLPLYQTQDNLAAISQVQGITIDGATGQPFGAYTIWLRP